MSSNCNLSHKTTNYVFPPITELMFHILATGIQSEGTISQSLSCNTLWQVVKMLALNNVSSQIRDSVGMREAASDERTTVKPELLRFVRENPNTRHVCNIFLWVMWPSCLVENRIIRWLSIFHILALELTSQKWALFDWEAGWSVRFEKFSEKRFEQMEAGGKEVVLQVILHFKHSCQYIKGGKNN